MAISGDTVVVGALFKNNAAGAAYVVVRVGPSWSEQQKLLSSDIAGGDRYGRSVAISGDTVGVVLLTNRYGRLVRFAGAACLWWSG